MVFVRNESGRQTGDAPDAQHREHQPDQYHQPADVHHAADQPGIGVFHPPIDSFKATRKPAREDISLLDRQWGAQPQRALCRLERSRIDRADQRRYRNNQGELREHLAAQAGHKGRRQEHRHQDKRNSDDGPE